tara:strand:- start:3698 stop:3946 length:249 start_codon:yes stop_codon:yes gene_type:complete
MQKYFKLILDFYPFIAYIILMNKEQIEHELKRKEADLAWWIEHKNDIASRNDEGGMVGVCDMQIDLARKRIANLKSLKSEQV